MTTSSFRLIAHRGASMRAPENTMSAFFSALQTGSREIETDVQCTIDNVLILCHDDTLTRYGHGIRRIEECTYAELSSLDFGSWFSPTFAGEPIVRLSSLLETFGTTFTYHLEWKGTHPLLAAQTLDMVRQHGLEASCVFTSFSIEQLRRARAHTSEARLGWLVTEITNEVCRIASQLQLFQICPKAEYINAETVRQALEVVPEVRAWGCPHESVAANEIVRAVRDAGCCGITINEPLWIEGPDGPYMQARNETKGERPHSLD